MAVLQAAKPIKCTGSVDSKFQRTYTTTWRVITSQGDSAMTAMSAAGLPLWGSTFAWGSDFDLWTTAQTIKADPEKETDVNPIKYNGFNATSWIVTIGYSSRPMDRSPGDTPEDPIDDAPVISGSFLGERKVAIRDKDGNPIANSAAEPYLDNPPTVLANTDTLRIQYNTATIDLAQRSEFVGCVNSTAIWGLSPRQALLVRWDWSVKYAGASLVFIQNSFEFHINRTETPPETCVGPASQKGWYTILPNRGFAPFKTANDLASKAQKKDKHDNIMNTPVWLKCDGTEETDPAEKHWNVFLVEREADFTTISGMPDPLPGPFV